MSIAIVHTLAKNDEVYSTLERDEEIDIFDNISIYL